MQMRQNAPLSEKVLTLKMVRMSVVRIKKNAIFVRQANSGIKRINLTEVIKF